MIARARDEAKVHHALYTLVYGCTRHVAFYGYILEGNTGILGDDVQYLFVTTSYGRNKDSLLHIYKIESAEEEVLRLQEYKVLTLPPMAEEICVNDDKMYFLFESGATTYSTVES